MGRYARSAVQYIAAGGTRGIGVVLHARLGEDSMDRIFVELDGQDMREPYSPIIINHLRCGALAPLPY